MFGSDGDNWSNKSDNDLPDDTASINLAKDKYLSLVTQVDHSSLPVSPTFPYLPKQQNPFTNILATNNPPVKHSSSYDQGGPQDATIFVD